MHGGETQKEAGRICLKCRMDHKNEIITKYLRNKLSDDTVNIPKAEPYKDVYREFTGHVLYQMERRCYD